MSETPDSRHLIKQRALGHIEHLPPDVQAEIFAYINDEVCAAREDRQDRLKRERKETLHRARNFWQGFWFGGGDFGCISITALLIFILMILVCAGASTPESSNNATQSDTEISQSVSNEESAQ